MFQEPASVPILADRMSIYYLELSILLLSVFRLYARVSLYLLLKATTTHGRSAQQL